MSIRSDLNAARSIFGISGQQDHNGKILLLFFFLSILFHAFIIIISVHHINVSKPLYKVVQVDLVSLTAKTPMQISDNGLAKKLHTEKLPKPIPKPTIEPEVIQQPPKPEAVKSPKPEAENLESISVKKEPPIVKPDINLKTKPKNLEQLVAESEVKKEEKVNKKPKEEIVTAPSTDERLANARKQQIEQKLMAQSNEKQLADALERMKASVQAKQNNLSEQKADGGGSLEGDGEIGQGGDRDKGIDLYKMSVKFAIEQNWVFNDVLARMNQGLEVKIFIKILQSGEIRDISYETRSGNEYLDESAKNAIIKANPLPELPKGMKSYEVVVVFTPRGLK